MQRGKYPDARKTCTLPTVSGQKVFIILQRFVVRLGLTDESEFDNNEVLKRCIRSFKKE
jgi:hypothetical protein